MPNKLVNITAMEIFRAGTWNGLPFKDADLTEMAENFAILQGKIKPKLKITHRDDQESLAGLASYGDVVNIYTETVAGEIILFANIEKVPEEVAQWIKEGRFAERSIELWLFKEIEGRTYKNVVYNVSLLGSEIPAVAGLSPVLAKEKDGMKVVDITDAGKLAEGLTAVNFAFDEKNRQVETVPSGATKSKEEGGKKRMNLEEQIAKMSARIDTLEKEKKDLEVKMADDAHKAELETFKARNAELEKEIADAKEFKANAEKLKKENDELKSQVEMAQKEKADAAKALKDKAVEGIIAKFKKLGKITPAVEEKVGKLLNSLNDSTHIAKFSEELEGKSVEVGYSQLRLFESIMDNLPKIVQFGELGGEVDLDDDELGEGGKKVKHGDEVFTTRNDDLTARAHKIMEKDNCTFDEAITKASKEFKLAGKDQ